VGIFASIVSTRIFEKFTSTSYLIVGIIIGIPPIVYPLLFPGPESHIDWRERYTTKANAFIFIFAWIGNYFWTHYFYRILGATYTFPSWRLNEVPFCLYLISHSYFLLYHTLANLLQRRFWNAVGNQMTLTLAGMAGGLVFAMAYTTALMEVWTIENFPYYSYPNRHDMFVYGSVFYAIYFIVSYPMFFRMDEGDKKWSLSRAIIEAFAAGMIVTILLDAWRLTIWPIHGNSAAGINVPFIA